MSKRVLYTAVVLDDWSRNELLDRIGGMIPNDWEIIAHHMTVNLGSAESEYMADFPIELHVKSIASDDKVIAVEVEGFPSKNKIPHITIAVNRKMGGKPVMSNNLVNWEPLDEKFGVFGYLTEVTN